jgi:protoporphyrinogen oxidase
MKGHIAILGGGPTGLGAAYRLKELGYTDFTLYERADHVGGLAASFTDESSFTWDVGGHVTFSHYEYFDKLYDRLIGEQHQKNTRESWVRMHGTWVPYPLQNNIRYLPKEVAFECLSGLITAQTSMDHRAAKNFEEFIAAVFGKGLCDHFMTPYNFKVWAHPANLMNKEWIGERVAVIDINRALRNVILEQDEFGWGPNSAFKYPLTGGVGTICTQLQKEISDHVKLGHEVVAVDLDRKSLRFASGETAEFEALLTTMPLDKLAKLSNGLSEDKKTKAAGLRHSGACIVGIGVRRPCPSSWSWMYFPESNCPFYRVTYLSNYSPSMTPGKDYFSLLCETSYSEFKQIDKRTIIEDTIQGLLNVGLLQESDRGAIASTWLYDAEYAYPTPSVERDGILKDVIPYLESKGVYSRGRFGLWKYEVSNTDHTVMQGVEWANRMLLGEPETTIGIQYEAS